MYWVVSHTSLHFNGHFSRGTWVSRYQNASILDVIRAKDDGGGGNNWSYKNDGGGGDNWSYKTCKTQAKSSPPTNQHLTFYRLDALPVAHPTVSEHN